MGLFPCTSFARLSSVFLTVALGLCAVESRATKIEFSVPASEVEVPDLQKEIKADAKAALKSELNFKGSLDVGPMAAPVVVAPPEDNQRDLFSTKDKDNTGNDRSDRTDRNNRNSRNDRTPQDDPSNAKRNAMLSEQYKAAKSEDQLRTDSSLSSSSWQISRRTLEREADTVDSSRDRSIGWSTLFKDAQEERDRKEQTARLNGFRALYETPNSMSPIGTPGPNSDPVKDSLWHEPGMNPRDGQSELFSRRDDPQYNQPIPGSRGSAMDTLEQGPTRSTFEKSQLAPVREFEQHRGVLEMPKRPGDILNR